MKRIILFVVPNLLFVLFMSSALAGNKIDPVGQEYIEQIKSLSARIVINEKTVVSDLERSDTKSADKSLVEMSSLSKEFKTLKLDAFKYYKGKLPKAFASEWNKYEQVINQTYKKKPKKEGHSSL